MQEVMKAYLSRKKEGVSPGKPPVKNGGDTLELSVQAREIQDVKTALKDIGDVREEKVEQIKSRIASGTYRADAGKIADGIIEERLLDKHV
jgi:negative regulator of flagellin synthesis FlgM